MQAFWYLVPHSFHDSDGSRGLSESGHCKDVSCSGGSVAGAAHPMKPAGTGNRQKSCPLLSWWGRSPTLQVQLQPPSHGCEPGASICSQGLGSPRTPEGLEVLALTAHPTYAPPSPIPQQLPPPHPCSWVLL